MASLLARTSGCRCCGQYIDVNILKSSRRNVRLYRQELRTCFLMRWEGNGQKLGLSLNSGVTSTVVEILVVARDRPCSCHLWSRHGIFRVVPQPPGAPCNTQARQVDFMIAPGNAENSGVASHGLQALRSRPRVYYDRVQAWDARKGSQLSGTQIACSSPVGAHLSMSESYHSG